jgi:F1F0 ATPase subunit 2
MGNETLSLVPALVAGVLLGLIFFGGLWWTVQKGVSSKRPALWFFGSQLLRTSIALAGIYFVGRGHWERLVACLVGFIIARFIVMSLTLPSEDKQTRPAQEADRAP